MLKLGRRGGHFMTLIEIRVHLIRVKPGHISLTSIGPVVKLLELSGNPTSRKKWEKAIKNLGRISSLE